ncbi:hypothetical protein GPROT1_00374 [Gammaproteobacteria bacterium]|nr:hypothetical protein GPROT1_00374 [Gammaproteobacteria bacterium]
MQHVYSAVSPNVQYFSLLSLMYGQQYLPQAESVEIDALDQEELVGHIEDLCDCI